MRSASADTLGCTLILLGTGCGELLGDYRVEAEGDGSGAALECGPTQAPSAEGTCEDVGVTECGEPGLMEPGDGGGCIAVVPDDCTGQRLATLDGSGRCSPAVAATCDVAPVTADVYVRPAPGGGGDGSLADPFGTITEALEDARQRDVGAITIGLYPGEYRESLLLDRETTLRGRTGCVSILGMDPTEPVIRIAPGAERSWVNAVEIREGASGIRVEASGVRVDAVTVRRSEGPGIVVDDVRDAPVDLSDIVVESARRAGIAVYGSVVQGENVQVRDTRPTPYGAEGRGVTIRPSRFADPDAPTEPGQEEGLMETSPASEVSLDGLVIDRSFGAGLWVEGSTVVADQVVVRDTTPEAILGYGAGVVVRHRPAGDRPASLELTHALIERSAAAGIFVENADATVRQTTLRDVGGAEGCSGRGVRARFVPLAPDAQPTSVELSHTLVEGAAETGVLIEGMDAVVDHLLLRDVAGCGASRGDGIVVYGHEFAPAALRMDTARVAAIQGVPVVRFGTDATVESSGGLYEDCDAVPDAGSDAVLGVDGGACLCGDDVRPCERREAPWPSPLAAVDGCEADDRVVCVDFCGAEDGVGGGPDGVGGGPHASSTYGLPDDDLVSSAFSPTNDCRTAPAPKGRRTLDRYVGRTIFPQLFTTEVGESDVPPVRMRPFWNAVWFSFGTRILGEPVDLSRGLMTVAVASGVEWPTDGTAAMTCFARQVRDCVPGVRVTLDAPSAGVRYTDLDNRTDGAVQLDATTPSGIAIAANIPPGEHRVRVELPDGVTCAEAQLFDGFTQAWETDEPGVYELPIAAGNVTVLALYCEDGRTEAEKEASYAAIPEGGG